MGAGAEHLAARACPLIQHQHGHSGDEYILAMQTLLGSLAKRVPWRATARGLNGQVVGLDRMELSVWSLLVLQL